MIAARALAALLAPTARRFRAALRDPARAQARVRRDLARRLARTEYGRHLGVRGEADLARVPVVDHDALLPWLERQRACEGPVLTPDRVICYEPTSGSGGAKKLIPYTRPLRRAFARMFAVWAHDLLAHGPRLESGRFFFSVSPSFAAHQATARGVPVGLADDRDYLDGWLRLALAPWFVGAGALARVHEPEAFRRALCALLLAEARLEVVSVWSPSFLLVHLAWLERERERLARDLGPALGPARRAALLRDPVDWRGVWPLLKVVSCWDAGAAAPQAAHLRRLLPGVLVQGKGLLATEAPVTIPLLDAPGHVPLVTEVLLELEDETGRLHALHEAAPGGRYGVVLSQAGGLTRYRLGDVVEVGPRHLGTPTLAFVGRQGGVSDLVGEKLSEAFVAGALAGLDAGEGFLRALVPLPGAAGAPARYALLLDRAAGPRDALARRLDEALGAAHHYRQARLLGQLEAPRVVVDPRAAEALAAFHVRRGVKLGDQKPRALEATPPDAELAAWLAARAGDPTDAAQAPDARGEAA